VNARKIGLLLLILGTGAALETAWAVRGHVGLGPAGCRVLGGRFYGPSFRFDAQDARPVAKDVRLEIANAFGAVRVRAGEPGQVKVALLKVVYRPSEEAAREFAARIHLTFEEGAGALRVGTNREELDRRHDVGFETHLTVEVPADAAVVVKNEHGETEVTDVARADVRSSFGSLQVLRIAGDAALEHRHGDVSAAGVGGTLAVTSRHGQVEVKEVTGRVTVDAQHGDVDVEKTGALEVKFAHGGLAVKGVAGDFQSRGEHGGVRVGEVSGSADVETSFGSVEASDVGGEARLSARHGGVLATDVRGAVFARASFDGVRLEKVAGPAVVEVEHGGVVAREVGRGFRAKVSGDSVELDAFAGPVDIDVDRGGASLRPRGPITEPVSVKTSNGGIRLEVPASSRFDLDARVRRGELAVNVPGLTMTESAPQTVKGALGGGGAEVRLSAEGGDLTLEDARERASRDE
jgi:DUF4097 and DUF4098 domain-containing protein YvlB